MAEDLQQLPSPKRYIPTNDENGESFFSTVLPESIPVSSNLNRSLQRIGYTTDRHPVSFADDADLKLNEMAAKDMPPLVRSDNGTNLWYVDMPPEAESPMHRTVSLDILILVSGELELVLSKGEQRLIKPGDMVVQRSTLHKWRNPSKTEWTRLVGIMTVCEPVVTKDGKTLGPQFPKSMHFPKPE